MAATVQNKVEHFLWLTLYTTFYGASNNTGLMCSCAQVVFLLIQVSV